MKSPPATAASDQRARLAKTLGRHGYALAVVAIITATALFLPGRPFMPREQWALAYVLVVAGTASLAGVAPALLAAILSFVAWDYFFLPPFYTLQVADPKDWIKLGVFLVVAALVGLQTGRMRQREAIAQAGERRMAALSRLGSRLVSENSVEQAAAATSEELVEALPIRAAILWLAEPDGRAVPAFVPPEADADRIGAEPFVDWAFANAKALAPGDAAQIEGFGWALLSEVAEASARRDIFLPLSSAEAIEGVLQIVPDAPGALAAPAAHDALASTISLVTPFLERQRLLALATQVEALQESESLKSALVSSVSHELKTPLASISATVTGLLQDEAGTDPARVASELSAVEADVERLDRSIGDLLDISRLEARTWTASKDRYDIGEIIGSVVSWLPGQTRGRIRYAVPDDLPCACVDFSQVARALHNVLENALAYSGPDEPVEIGARSARDGILVWVRDAGPGIPDQEKQLVYDKFYRGAAGSRRGSSTGLGLTVAKELIRANGGTIWVEDAEPRGAVFMILLQSSDGPATAPAPSDSGQGQATDD